MLGWTVSGNYTERKNERKGGFRAIVADVLSYTKPYHVSLRWKIAPLLPRLGACWAWKGTQLERRRMGEGGSILNIQQE